MDSNRRRQSEEWLELLPGLSWPDRLLLAGIVLLRRLQRRMRRREFWEEVYTWGRPLILGG